jgi:hypothetical protein
MAQRRIGQVGGAAMANYLDLCAIALPCGFDRQGLPIGLQLIGLAGAEAALLAAAWAIGRLLASRRACRRSMRRADLKSRSVRGSGWRAPPWRTAWS